MGLGLWAFRRGDSRWCFRRRLAALTLLATLTTSCDLLDQAISPIAGWDEVALSRQPFELNAVGQTFTSKKPLRSLGITSACVVLKSPYPMRTRAQTDRDFEGLLRGAKISAVLTAIDGRVYRADSIEQAWASDGIITSGEELSACVSGVGSTAPPEGTLISTVRIVSDKPLHVLGVYWQSMPKVEGKTRAP